MRARAAISDQLDWRGAAVLGLAWGLFCGFGNGIPIASTLAQMAVPWVWVAAVAAYRSATTARQAALLGGVALLAANVVYFVVGVFGRGVSGLSPVDGLRFFALWTPIGLLIGPIAGLVGWWLTRNNTALVAATALAVVSIAEPLALWAHIDHLDAHLAYVAVAIVGFSLPLTRMWQTPRTAGTAAAMALALSYPVAVVLEAVLIALGQISAPMRLI